MPHKEVSLEQFLVILEGHRAFQVGRDYRGIEPQKIMSFKGLTEFVDYQCGFDASGLCACKRKRLGSGAVTIKDKQCCCTLCAARCGYIDYIPSVHAAQEIAKLYSVRNGFWTTNGCSLPRKYRSSTCLTHQCYHSNNEWDNGLFAILHVGYPAVVEYYLRYIGKHNVADMPEYLVVYAVYDHMEEKLKEMAKQRQSGHT